MPGDYGGTSSGAMPDGWGATWSDEWSCVWLLSSGYGLAAVMLIVYVAVESSPIHRSSTIESIYLAVVMTVVQAFSEFVTRHICRQNMFCSVQADSALRISDMLYIMRLVLFMQIIRHNTKTTHHPPYQSRQVFTEFGQGTSVDEPTLQMQRYSLQIQTALTDQQTPTVAEQIVLKILSESNLVPLLYVLFMLTDYLAVSPALAKRFHWFGYLDVALYASIFWLLLRKSVFGKGSAQIIHNQFFQMVSSRDKDSLNYVISAVSMGTLMEVARWRTVRMITGQAVDMALLSNQSKTILVDALQKKGLRSQPVALEVLHIIESFKGDELTQFKNAIDEGGDYFNLYKLVYKDIVDAQIREDILRHFVAEARAARSQHGGGVGVKVLSDVDDTLYSSGGRFPAGCDDRFPKHVIYPGCLSLFRILDRTHSDELPSCNLVFLSARPHVFKDYAEDRTYQLFNKLVEKGQMHCMPTLLPGELGAGFKAMVGYPFRRTRAWLSVGRLKTSTYLRFRELYQEYDFIFFGDNGQGDLWAGQTMLDCTAATRLRAGASRSTDGTRQPLAQPQARQEPRLLGVFIHEVMPCDRCLTVDMSARERGDQWREALRRQGLHLHSSYVGAALGLHECQPEVMSLPQVVEVATAAMKEFDTMRLMYPDWSERWAAAECALQRDLERASARLEEAGMPKLESLRLTKDLHIASIHGARDPGPALRSRDYRGRTLAPAVEVEMEACGSSFAAAEPRPPASAAASA